MAPIRKGKKGTLHYALENGDRASLPIAVSKKNKSEDGPCLDVLDMDMKKRRDELLVAISPLQSAVTLGHYSKCKRLVEEGSPLTSSCSIPHPLCIALQKGNFEIANLFIKSGADVSLASGDSFPLDFAFQSDKCNEAIVKSIHDAGFPINSVINLNSGRTALHYAVKKNLLSIVKYLCSLPVDVNVEDSNKLSPLHYAVQEDLPEIVKLLAEKGAKLDCECSEHLTPMFYAIAAGNCKMVKLLISLGADIHHVSNSKTCSMMPLHFAAHTFQFKVTQLLLEKGADVNRVVPQTKEIALHAAARSDLHADLPKGKHQSKISLDCIVELLVKQGSDMKARNVFNLTPLQVAIKARHLSVARILITNGSEINNPIKGDDESDYTTFHLVSKLFDKDLIELCFEHGANCMLKDEGLYFEGLYPCHLALLTSMLDTITHGVDCAQAYLYFCQFEHVSIFKLFWKHNFPFDLTTKMQWLNNDNPPIPTKIAAQIQKQKMLFAGLKNQQLKVVQKAISQGAEVKCCSTEIQFPLHFIASKGNEHILKLFLSRGVVVNCLDNWGETPLHLAARGGYLNCCRLLLEHGAVYNFMGPKCPKTPLQVAKDKGHTEVVFLFTSVDKYFKGIKKGRLRKLKPEMKIFMAVMNCCNRDGSTLMVRALRLGFKDKAERLMNLKAHCCST